MAEFLSPGVFIEEVPSAVQTVQAVSTSNMAIVGYTPKGPTDEATLITSSIQFDEIFGGMDANTFTGHAVMAFFANGGRRCFVVRVVPSDSVEADVDILSRVYNQWINEGTASADQQFTDSAPGTPADLNTTIAAYNGNATPAGTNMGIEIRWRGAGTPVTTEAVRNRDDSADVAQVGAPTPLQSYEFRVDPSSLPALAEGDYKQFVVDPSDDFVLNTDPTGGAALLFTVPAPTAGTVGTVTTAQGSVCTFDFATGYGSVKFAGTEEVVVGGDAITITCDYTPTTVSWKIRDDGAGNLEDVVAGSLSGSGADTINYNDGTYDFETGATTAIPHEGAPLLADYYYQIWDCDPISNGAWANEMQVRVSGNLDYFTVATQSYSRHDFAVLQYNSGTGEYDVTETYEALDFTDSTSTQYFPDVVNELSDLISVTTPGGDAYPGSLDGWAYTSYFGGGDEDNTAGNSTFGGTQIIPAAINDFSVGARACTINYTGTTSGALTITDDGSGGLTGSVDPAYATVVTVGGVTLQPNTIDYDTGYVNFKTLETIEGGTLISATFYVEAEETSNTDQFGDANKRFTDSDAVVHFLAGDNGTFTTGTYSRAEFTNPTLQASKRGLYALDEVDELLNVIIPDFAGDVTVTGDLLDYAASRANLPSGGDRFIILTVPLGSDPQEAVDWFRYDLGRFSKWAALYWPWINVADPLVDGRTLTMPPMGHIAGIYARTDNNKSVGKAPAGTVDGALNWLTGLEYISTQGERDYVYPNKINPLISSPQTGLAVWGARTISSESEWRYVHARRLFMFMEKSIYNSTAWIVFENNGPQLWAKIKGQIDGFMSGLFSAGLFYGTSASQAYFVICDSSNNTTSTIEAGQVIIDVGAAPNRPAEFVRFRFQQATIAA